MRLEFPMDFGEASGKELDNHVLRAAISAQFEATNYYELLAGKVEAGEVKDILLALVAKQKEHSKELWALLRKGDVAAAEVEVPKFRPEDRDEIDSSFDWSH